ncbi:hypothetical protein [Microlunatus sp. GCM10028923]|uniref:hypothetical protein n=1 Tax=Microlunatus sp. GCM10028923 TaxID=3273400 RepID=UPI003620A80E
MKIGSLLVSLRYDGEFRSRSGERRQRYAYRIEDLENPDFGIHISSDLMSAAHADVDLVDALRTLTSFLAAAGEAYSYTLRLPGSEPDNLHLFPLWVAESAYLNADEMAIFHADAADAVNRTARWISIVFLQGPEVEEALELLNKQGPNALVVCLAKQDFGEETTRSAVRCGHVYERLPSSDGYHLHHQEPYALIYNPDLRHVGLLRQIEHLARQSPSPDRISQRPGRSAALPRSL